MKSTEWKKREREKERRIMNKTADGRTKLICVFLLFFYSIRAMHALSFGCRVSISNLNKYRFRQISCRRRQHLLTQIIDWINAAARWKNGTHKTIKTNMKMGFEKIIAMKSISSILKAMLSGRNIISMRTDKKSTIKSACSDVKTWEEKKETSN